MTAHRADAIVGVSTLVTQIRPKNSLPPQQIGLWPLIRGEILKRGAVSALSLVVGKEGYVREGTSKGPSLTRSFCLLFLAAEKVGPPRTADKNLGVAPIYPSRQR